LVKSIKPEYSENKEYLDKLKKEFDATFLAESINIPHVLGFGKIRVSYDSIVMEYIEGKNILETIKENKLSPSEVLPFIKQLCKTIDYLHSNRIILNHITPQNIIITNSGILKIIDFSNVEYMHNPIKEIKSDINSVGNILTQIDNIMPIKFQHIKKTIQKCNRYDYNSFNNASEIYNSLSGNKKFISIFITLFSILFTAIICSVLFYNTGKNSNTNYSYSEGLDINPGQDIGLSSSIIIYDTLSKLVIYDAQKNAIVFIMP
jgi:Serine/threonine protein kinase